MKIKPAGYYVLVEVEPRSKTYENSVIEMAVDDQKREHGGRDVGKIIAFGPIAFKGFENCEGPEDWGVSVGDMVEFGRYDGKIPRHAEVDESCKNLRILIDNDILAVVETDHEG